MDHQYYFASILIEHLNKALAKTTCFQFFYSENGLFYHTPPSAQSSDIRIKHIAIYSFKNFIPKHYYLPMKPINYHLKHTTIRKSLNYDILLY